MGEREQFPDDRPIILRREQVGSVAANGARSGEPESGRLFASMIGDGVGLFERVRAREGNLPEGEGKGDRIGGAELN